jgi:hypothetical protein
MTPRTRVVAKSAVNAVCIAKRPSLTGGSTASDRNAVKSGHRAISSVSSLQAAWQAHAAAKWLYGKLPTPSPTHLHRALRLQSYLAVLSASVGDGRPQRLQHGGHKWHYRRSQSRSPQHSHLQAGRSVSDWPASGSNRQKWGYWQPEQIPEKHFLAADGWQRRYRL